MPGFFRAPRSHISLSASLPNFGHMIFAIFSLIFGLTSGCIPTYNPDFDNDALATTLPPLQQPTTATVPQPTTVVVTTTPVITTTTTSITCLPGWSLDIANKFCYRINSARTLWAEAEAACTMTSGSHLASITDMDEFLFIYNLAVDYNGGNMFSISLWIGASAPEPTGPFTWTDGNPFTYTKWSTVNSNGMGMVCVYYYTYPQSDGSSDMDGWRYAPCDDPDFTPVSLCKLPAMIS